MVCVFQTTSLEESPTDVPQHLCARIGGKACNQAALIMHKEVAGQSAMTKNGREIHILCGLAHAQGNVASQRRRKCCHLSSTKDVCSIHVLIVQAVFQKRIMTVPRSSDGDESPGRPLNQVFSVYKL